MAWWAEPGRPRPMRKGNWPASRYLRPKQRLSFTPGVGRSDKRCDDALGQCLAIGTGEGEAAGKHVLTFRRSCRTHPAACAQVPEIGRAACRERVGKAVELTVGAGPVKK